MSDTLLAPVRADSKPKPPPMKHVRCCKPALPKGLCRSGGPPGTPGENYNPTNMDHCKVCWEMWREEHHLSCPKDSGRWRNQ